MQIAYPHFYMDNIFTFRSLKIFIQAILSHVYLFDHHHGGVELMNEWMAFIKSCFFVFFENKFKCFLCKNVFEDVTSKKVFCCLKIYFDE